MRVHVLLVDDAPAVRQQLSGLLERADITCRPCADAHEALHCVRHDPYDVIATDWSLGKSPLDLDGIRLTQLVRALGLRTPVLLYSARVWRPVDVAVAIEAGADDYLEAPLERFEEFVARLRGLVRRSSGQIPIECLRVGGFAIDVVAHRASFEGDELSLTRAQFDLLVHFAAHVESVLTYDQLYVFLAGRTHASKEERAHVIHEAVRRLRARIGKGAAQLRTIPGRGYRLTGARNDLTA